MLQVLRAEPEVHEEEALLVPASGEQQVGALDVLLDDEFHGELLRI